MRFIKTDGGRKLAGFKGTTSDCATRAIAIATGLDYKFVYETITERKAADGSKKSARSGIAGITLHNYLKYLGFKKIKVSRLTYREAVEEYPNGILETRNHVVAVREGDFYDSHNSAEYIFNGEKKYRKVIAVWVRD